MSSYPSTSFRRTALAPGLLAAVVLIAGVALIESESGFLWIRYATSILALIVCVFTVQAGQRWWLVALIPIAVLWNPVFPLTPAPLQLWVGLQYLAAIVFIVVAIRLKVRAAEDPRRGKA